MNKLSLLKNLFIALAFAPISSFADTPKVVFEANKNQLPQQVKFKADIGGGALFLESNTFTYVLKENINWHRDHRNESGGPVTQKQHAYKVHFENSNPNVEVFGNNKYSWHRNYYIGNDESKWASNVPVFAQVYYQDLYSNIDIKYYNKDVNLKYDIIVRPGGNTKQIKLNYEGTDGMKIENGHLFIKTSIYDILEQKPYAYQLINGVEKQISCSYVLKNKNVSFEVGEYDKTLPLIIDPTLIAATYSGSTADNWGFTATYDDAQNIYMGGIAAGTGYPTTFGAHDQTYNGGQYSANSLWPFDISITKFNPTGTSILYSTYYGGILNEQPHSLVVNSNNELYVVGRTNSTNFPTTAGAYDQTQNGGYDIIVGKFSSTGALLASTFVGGSADDCVNYSILWSGAGSYGTTKFSYTDDGRSEIIIDAASNVYVAACTKSINFPTAPVGTTYQQVFGGVQDAVVFKLSPNLNALTFSTYLGGSGTDAAYGLKLNNSGEVFVTGGTTGNFPTTAGVLQPTYNGGLCDAFIAVLNATGTGLVRSTYLGTTAYDQAYMIEIDASGDLYVFGQTQGAYPTTAGVYKNNNSGQFIHKVTGTLTATVFSTTIGTGPAVGTPAVNISPTAFLVDSCQTIYIAGWGRSSVLSANMPSPSTTTGLPVTANAQQSNTDGKDHYFMVLEPNAKGLFYATFYGEGASNPDADHVDGGTCRFDKRGVIYQACCASCGGTQGFPTMPGAYSTTNNSNHINYPLPTSPNTSVFNCNQAVVKMDVSVKPVAKANVVGATTGCAPFPIQFNNTGSSASNFIWDFGDGGTSTAPSPTYTYNFAGTFTITLYAIDSIGICGYIDTSRVVVTVGAQPTLSTNSNNILCSGGVGTATVSATGGIPQLTYAWTPIGGNSSVATGLTAGYYTVTVTDSTGCASTNTVLITEPNPIAIVVTTQGATCGVANGSATASASGGTPSFSYSWSPGGGTTSSISGLASGNYTVTATDGNGCTSSQTANIPVANGPTVTVASTSVICNGGNTGSATANLTSGTAPYTYAWSPGSAGVSQTATGLVAGNYIVIITDATGCSATGSVTISEPPPINPTINANPVLCFGANSGSATVSNSGTPPYNYMWSNGQNGATATGLIAGTYSVLVTDANGCTGAASTTITQPPSGITVNSTVSGSACGPFANGVISSTASNGSAPYNYLWSSGQTTPVISNVAGGTYTLIVTDANNCTYAEVVIMPTSVKPTANFSYIETISCEGISFAFSDASSNALTYLWDFSGLGSSTSANPGFVFPYNGTYNVTLIVTNPPCKDTLTKPVIVGDLGSGIVLKEANVFTPNNDGLNDCFHISMINSATGLPDEVLLPCTDLEVFDRWGVKMYESLGLNGANCWNGNNKSDSKPAPDGTYYYIAKLGNTSIRGYVTLARHK